MDATILLSARTIAVIGRTGGQMIDRGWAEQSGFRAAQKVSAVLAEWGRYEAVTRPEDADLVLAAPAYPTALHLARGAQRGRAGSIPASGIGSQQICAT
jgi:hypothetical protein